MMVLKMKKNTTYPYYKKNNRVYKRLSIFIASFLIILASALALWHYQPWHLWQTEQLLEQLRSPQTEVRQEALTTLRSWPLAQQQKFVRRWQGTLLTAYEETINTSLINGEWRTAQVLLADLQRLYPQLPIVQRAQQQISTYHAQLVNDNLSKINSLLSDPNRLSASTLNELSQLEDHLQALTPDHALVFDSRILYTLLLAIDNSLAQGDFALAKQQIAWGEQYFPNAVALQDRQIQVEYQLRGKPAQVLEDCLRNGQSCWQISTNTPVFSQPWILQQGINHPWLTQSPLIPIVQEQLGEYYREQALQDYDARQLTLTAVNLMRAAYFTPLSELDTYWQWLAFAFNERNRQETMKLKEAELAAIQHTFFTQIAALDVLGAQRSVTTMQKEKMDPQFMQQVAFVMLGDAYLRLAQHLAAQQQYQLAIRLLVAGKDFLPQNTQMGELLAEYKRLNQEQQLFAENASAANTLAFSQSLTHTLQGPVDLQSEISPNTTQDTDKVAAIIGDPCAAQISAQTAAQVSYCQDQLANGVLGPPLIILPKAAATPEHLAINKYPVSINDYNYFCRTTKSCEQIALASPEKPEIKSAKPPANLPAELDLRDVQNVMADYDTYCRSSGNCNSIEPQAQDIPVTNITLNNALNYAAWLSKQTGYIYRLPTSEEWSYAIKANTQHLCSQNTLLGLQKKLIPVQQGMQNTWGVTYQLAEMREWVLTPQGVGTVGPEKPGAQPVCELPIDASSKAGAVSPTTGFRLVREIKR